MKRHLFQTSGNRKLDYCKQSFTSKTF